MTGNYVDGFVLPIPTKNTAAYTKMAKEAGKIWMKFGALAYYECEGEDLKVKPKGGMKTRSFPDMAGAKKGENVWFSFIVYKNKKHRDAVNKKVMAYFDEKYKDAKGDQSMPFDMERISYGGFTSVVKH